LCVCRPRIALFLLSPRPLRAQGADHTPQMIHPAGSAVVRSDDHGGLGLYAARFLPAGAAILTDHPLVAALPPQAAPWRCRACLAPLSSRSRERTPPCLGCHRARWCDSACRADDAVGHVGSGECALLATEATAPGALLAWPGLLRDACLALRILARPDGKGADLATDAEEVGRDPTAGPRLCAAAAALAAAAGVGAATGGAAPSVTPESAAKALRAAALNAVELEEIGGTAAGPADNRSPPPPAALYALAARTNHSCRPTAVFVPRRRGGKLVMRTLVDVEAGAELTVAYTDPVAPRNDRRAALGQGWGFACACERCDGRGGDALLGEAASSSSIPALAALEAEVEAAAAPGRAPGAVVEALGRAAARALGAGAGPAHVSLLRLHLLLPGACAAVAGEGRAMGSPAGARAAAATALLSAAIPALAADALASTGGETGALLFGGRAWAVVAGRLLALAALDMGSGDEDWAGALARASEAVAGGGQVAAQAAAGPPLNPGLARAVAAAVALARVGVGAPHLIPLPTLDASLGRLGIDVSGVDAATVPPLPRWSVWAAAAAFTAARASDLLCFCLGEASSAVEASTFAAMHHADRLPFGLASAITAEIVGARRWGPDVVP